MWHLNLWDTDIFVLILPNRKFMGFCSNGLGRQPDLGSETVSVRTCIFDERSGRVLNLM